MIISSSKQQIVGNVNGEVVMVGKFEVIKGVYNKAECRCNSKCGQCKNHSLSVNKYGAIDFL